LGLQNPFLANYSVNKNSNGKETLTRIGEVEKLLGNLREGSLGSNVLDGAGKVCSRRVNGRRGKDRGVLCGEFWV